MWIPPENFSEKFWQIEDLKWNWFYWQKDLPNPRTRSRKSAVWDRNCTILASRYPPSPFVLDTFVIRVYFSPRYVDNDVDLKSNYHYRHLNFFLHHFECLKKLIRKFNTNVDIFSHLKSSIRENWAEYFLEASCNSINHFHFGFKRFFFLLPIKFRIIKVNRIETFFRLEKIEKKNWRSTKFVCVMYTYIEDYVQFFFF